PLILTPREVVPFRRKEGSHATRRVEGRRAGPPDGPLGPHAPLLRRDRPAEPVGPHRVGAPAVHRPRRGAVRAGRLAGAAGPVAGGNPRLPGPGRLLAAARGRAAPGPAPRADRLATAALRPAGRAGGGPPRGGRGVRRDVPGNDRGDEHVGEVLHARADGGAERAPQGGRGGAHPPGRGGVAGGDGAGGGRRGRGARAGERAA